MAGLCVGFHVSAALPRELPHYSQSGAHEVAEEQRQNEEAVNLPGCAGCQHGNLVSQHLQQALGVGRRLLNLCYAVNGLGRTRLSPCLVKDVDSSSTDSVLSKHGSPVCSPAIYVYLIQNVFAFGFSVCVYIAACTCLAKSQHWENVGFTVIPVLE